MVCKFEISYNTDKDIPHIKSAMEEHGFHSIKVTNGEVCGILDDNMKASKIGMELETKLAEYSDGISCMLG